MSTLQPSESDVVDEFSYETRMVVLNFMSLFPTEGVSQHSSSSGSLVSSGSLERNKKILQDQYGLDHVPEEGPHEPGMGTAGSSLQQVLPSLPESSLMERVIGVNEHPTNADSDGEDEPDMVQRPTNLKLASRINMGNSLDSPNPPRPQPSPPRKKSSSLPQSLRGSIDRQVSNTSASSDGTDGTDASSLMLSSRSCASQRSNYVDVQFQDLDPFVRQGILPPQVLPLQQQLNREIKQFHAKAKSPSPNPRANARNPTPPPPLTPSVSVMTPQSEVAEQLRIIGDNVQIEYGKQVELAFQSVMSVPKSDLSYSFVEKILVELTEQIPALSQRAAVVMLLSQRLAMYGRDLHSLVNFTVRFLTDRMASFILSHGGWASILALDDVTESPMTPGDIQVVVPQHDVTDGGGLDLPNASLHTVSTSSSTLVGLEEAEAQEMVTSLVDSGFLAGSSTHLETAGIGRDATMESIVSIPSDGRSPVDLTDWGTETQRVESPRVPVTELNKDSMTLTNGHADTTASASAEQPLLSNCSSNNQTDTTDVNKVKREIDLLRQLSDAPLPPREPDTDIIQTMGLVALGSTLACCAAYVIYKKATKN